MLSRLLIPVTAMLTCQSREFVSWQVPPLQHPLGPGPLSLWAVQMLNIWQSFFPHNLLGNIMLLTYFLISHSFLN